MQSLVRKLHPRNHSPWQKLLTIAIGLAATLWFLIRVIPKPSRAAYPCQRAAFPVASGFLLWLCSLFTIKPLINKIRNAFPRRLWLGSIIVTMTIAIFILWTMAFFNTESNAVLKDTATRYDFVPAKSNEPKGIAKGIFPGRVVWAHDPKATKWKGNWKSKTDQLILSMIRQLVHKAHVAPKDIVIVDVRRFIHPYLLTKVWKEFKDVRFVQVEGPKDGQPKNPAYGDYHGLDAPVLVEGVTYSSGKYDKARFIPKQLYDAAYIINMALLKGHSYPYNTMEDGDEGQTGISMCGKNHFGSIQGPWELHAAINTNQEAVKNAYSLLVDLAASPNLGAKTILFILNGLY